MKQKRRRHLRGRRGQAFADLVRGICPEQILCVSIDVSKDFHVVLLHDGLGEIVLPSFDVDIFRTGFEGLCQAVDKAVARIEAQVVLVGMEPTGHYYENLARHIQQTGQKVTIVNSFAVKENRRQQMMAHEKDDDIDVAAIGDLLRRGEGSPFRPPTGIYLQMQQLERARLGEVKVQTLYKNRVIGHLDRIFPGLILTKTAAKERYKPLFSTGFWQCQTLQHLVRIRPDPRELAAMSPAELVAVFHQQGLRMGPHTARRITHYAGKVLWPEPEVVAIRRQLLANDLQTLDAVSARTAHYSQQLQQLLAQTPYHFLTQLKGLTPARVASLAATIGDPANYTHAGQVFRRSGLVSGRNDSGARQRQGRGQAITKSGDSYLRRALNDMLNGLILHQPVLRTYYHRLKQTKPVGVARVATIRRAVGIIWATLRDQRADTLILRGENEMT
jgi:transposase